MQSPFFAKNLRMLLIYCDLDYGDLYAPLRISRRSVQKYCKGEQSPNRQNLRKIADFFHVYPEALINQDIFSLPKEMIVPEIQTYPHKEV